MRFSTLMIAFISSYCHATPLISTQGISSRSNIWETLPATPALPSPISSASYSKDGIKLWFQKYSTCVFPDQDPIVLIHGGLGKSIQNLARTLQK